MTMLYQDPCYNDVYYKGTALWILAKKMQRLQSKLASNTSNMHSIHNLGLYSKIKCQKELAKNKQGGQGSPGKLF